MSTYNLRRIEAATGIRWIDYHPELGSTNDRAIEILKNSPRTVGHLETLNHPPHSNRSPGESRLPLLVLTDRQTRGRGQHHRPWTAAEGAITFSLCLDSGGLSWPAGGTVGLGWGVCQAIERIIGHPVPGLSLKWPNDILLGSCKLGGILVEQILPGSANQSFAGTASVWVIGIGLNVNNPINLNDLIGHGQPQDTSSPIKPTLAPTSLIQTLGRSVDQTALLIELLGQSDLVFQRLSREPASLIEEVYRRLVFRDQMISVRLGDRKILRGRVTGLGPGGELLILREGKTDAINSGQIIDWQPAPTGDSP